MHSNARNIPLRPTSIALACALSLLPGCSEGLDAGGSTAATTTSGDVTPETSGVTAGETSDDTTAADTSSDGAGSDDASDTTTGAGTEPRANYYVEGRRLFDPCGEEVVLRGVNHPTIFVDRPGQAMTQIAETGANAVRLFWFANKGVSITEAEAAVTAAVENGMVPMLEMHDSTCAWDLAPIVDYWTQPEAVAFIQKHQDHLLVNIANEASAPSSQAFRDTYQDIIQTMRDAGIHTPLVIDAGRCGREYQMLFDHGQSLIDADPDHNLVFSAHLYDAMDAPGLTSVLEQAVALDLPFIVGELANKSPPGCGTPLQYGHLITEAQRLDIGWLAWSWGDNDPDSWWNGDCWEFDMTRTFSFDTLERWGEEVALDHPASIQNTSVRTHFLQTGTCESFP